MKVVAHRGLRGKYTENSLASFKAAAKTNADAIEFDIQATADGHFVVLHSMGSPKKVFGIDKNINDMPWDEIRNYKSKDGEQIPTFEEVLMATGKKQAMIDIKDLASADLLIKKLPQIDMTRIAVINSLHLDALLKIKQAYPNLNLSLQTYKRPLKTISLAKRHGFSHVSLVLYTLNPLTYLVTRRAGLKILTYQNYASVLMTWRWFTKLLGFIYPGIVIISDRADKIT